MKKLATLWIFIFSMHAFSQNLAECGLDDDPKLTQVEAEFLKVYMNELQLKSFDFTGKKVIFVTGNSGHTMISKSKYFDYIKKWDAGGHKIATWVVALNTKQNEQLRAAGYDVIVTCWVKFISKRRIRKIIEGIK